MISNIVRIQLVTTELDFEITGQTGFLDVKEGSAFPINKAISDIRDVQSRTGSYTKTLTLVGNKNNNLLLNNYFNLNVEAGTFDVNKVQECVVIQNGVTILDNAYIRLMKVVDKEDNSHLQYDEVEYEVQIRDAVSDFFKEANNKLVTELSGWDAFEHKYTIDNIIDSFDNTVDDGYKYVLPWIDDSDYRQNEILPGIYAKQIFDRIHHQGGYSYQWDDLDDKYTQFDKLLLPYSGDVKKIAEADIEKRRIIANKLTPQLNIYALHIGNSLFTVRKKIEVTNELVDPLSLYNPATSVYNNDVVILPDNAIEYKVTINWKLDVRNPSSVDTIQNGNSNMTDGLPKDEPVGVAPSLEVRNQFGTVRGSGGYNTDNLTINNFGSHYPLMSDVPMVRVTEGGGLMLNGRMELHPGEVRDILTSQDVIYVSVTNIAEFSQMELTGRLDILPFENIYKGWRKSSGGDLTIAEWRTIINSITIEIAPSADSGLLPGTDMNLQRFLPAKLKQSDFLKSIFQKYNLYSVLDKDNPKKIIYKTRDKFYAGGKVIDLSDKLCKELPQEITPLPEITAKKTILTYKDDDGDPVLSAYKDETRETYAQVEFNYSNENVKGVERVEELFSPTVNVKTNFDAVLPALPPNFKYNPRILIDGGQLNCGTYTIGGVAVNVYPYVGMLDKPYDAQFSIEYGLPDYYAYNVGTTTGNNLYNLKWRRTLTQKNDGKMFKASFWIDETLFEKIDLDDTIKVKENFFYINKIIDYDGNSYRPTLMELLTVEDDLNLLGGLPVGGTGEVPAGITGKNPIKPNTQLGGNKYATSLNTEERWATSSVSPNNTVITQSKGVGNVLPQNFRGIVAADNQFITRNGFYIAGANLTSNGVEVGKDVQLTSTGLNVNGTQIGSTGLTKTSKYIDDDYTEQGYFEEQITGLVLGEGNTSFLGDIVLDETAIPTTTSSAGIVGTIKFDDNYMYIRTSVGWKRTLLQTF